MAPAPHSWDALGAELAKHAHALFGVVLGGRELSLLGEYVSLLESWSARLNLVSARSTAEVVYRHVLDSLAPVPFLGSADVLADAGSGAGLPGIPLAVAAAAGRVWLLESRARRVSFLRNVVRTLRLPNVAIRAGRAEDFGDEVPDVVIGRGVADAALSAIAGRLLGAGGRLVAMRTARQGRGTWPGFEQVEARPYELPGGFRHEVVLLRRRFT